MLSVLRSFFVCFTCFIFHMATRKEHDKMQDFENKMDEKINKFAAGWLVENVANNSVVKSILDSHTFESMNKSISEHFDTIMKVIAVLAIISGAMWVLWFLGWLGMIFWTFGGKMMILLLLWLVGSLIALAEWFGIFKQKKWVPFLILVWFAWNIVSMILSAWIWSGTYMVGYRWSYWLTIILSIIVILFVLKNRGYFSK